MSLDAATVDAILEDIADHGNLRRACRDHHIEPNALYRAMRTDEALCQRYARAKADGCAGYLDDTIELQDEEPPHFQTQFGSRVDPGWVAWQKNRVDLRKWHLSKLQPKVYGERTTIAGDADNPLAISDVSDAKADLARRLGAATAAGTVAGVAREPDE